MNLYPMSFMEFLKASGEELLVEKLGHIKSANPLPEIVHSKLTDLLKMYLYLGGMSEVVEIMQLILHFKSFDLILVV